uniref:RNase H type-1 domain-containing protein n=1 Tax=Brassica oleracea var. oleracea TaxID=109376 RepID=A0A0D3DLB8_BRAOL
MGARNVRACLSPLHAEIETLIWAMKCMRNLRQFQVTFATDCSQLVKMVSEPEEWLAFASYLEDLKILKASFLRSEIIYVSRTHNTKADSLARSVWKQPSFFVHMDADLPTWFTESNMNVYKLMTKKKKKNLEHKF